MIILMEWTTKNVCPLQHSIKLNLFLSKCSSSKWLCSLLYDCDLFVLRICAVWSTNATRRNKKKKHSKWDFVLCAYVFFFNSIFFCLTNRVCSRIFVVIENVSFFVNAYFLFVLVHCNWVWIYTWITAHTQDRMCVERHTW